MFQKKHFLRVGYLSLPFPPLTIFVFSSILITDVLPLEERDHIIKNTHYVGIAVPTVLEDLFKVLQCQFCVVYTKPRVSYEFTELP